MAFKVFNGREEKAEATHQAHLQQKVSLQTQALVAALRPAAHQAPGGGGPSKPAKNSGGVLPGPVSSAVRRDTGHVSAHAPDHLPSPAWTATSLDIGIVIARPRLQAHPLHSVWRAGWSAGSNPIA